MKRREKLIQLAEIAVRLLFLFVFFSCSVSMRLAGAGHKEPVEKNYSPIQLSRGGNLQEPLSLSSRVFIIKKEIDLRGQTMEIEPNAVLLFKGGRIKNGLIVGNMTTIVGEPSIDAKIGGTFQNKEIYSSWFSNDSDITISAIKAACESGVSFVIDDNRKLTNTIFLFGHGSLKGRGGAIDFISKTANGVCVLCGTDGVHPNMWSGVIDSVTININDYQYGIALCNVSHCMIRNNIINARNIPSYRGGKLISRFNNADFCLLSGPQTDIIISGNVLNMHGKNDGTESSALYESISVCDYTDNAKILNNVINNSTDDLGIHSCSNIAVVGNKIVTETGRIYCADSYNVTISNNTMGCYSNSMGIMVTMESQNRICENIQILDNHVYPLCENGLAYGIRVNNGKRISIRDNKIEGQLHIGYNQECVLENPSSTPMNLKSQDRVVDYVEVKNNSFTYIIGAGWNYADNYPKEVLIEDNVVSGGKIELSLIPTVKNLRNRVIESR